MTTGRQAILDAFDRLFDAAIGRVGGAVTPEERAQARDQFATRMGPAFDAIDTTGQADLPPAVVDEMRQAIEHLSPADIAGLLASIPLAQRTQELLQAVAFDRARQQFLVHLTEQARPSPYGAH